MSVAGRALASRKRRFRRTPSRASDRLTWFGPGNHGLRLTGPVPPGVFEWRGAGPAEVVK